MNRDAFKHLDNDLISLAYTMAVEPQRLEQMMELLDARLEHHLDRDEIAGTPIEASDALVEHFDRAMSLLERHGRNNAQAKTSIRFMEFDYQPSATIRMDGTFDYVNNPAMACFDWKSGETIKPTLFETGDFARFCKALSNLPATGHEQFLGVYKLVDQTCKDESHLQIALSNSVNEQGETIGRLSTIHPKIAPDIAEEFKSSLGLTQTELAITQAIVAGHSITEIAQNRDRAVNTVRTQLKALLAKLDLHSQVELVCFYSGFGQFSVQRRKKDLIDFKGLTPYKSAVLERPDGRKISYDIVGPSGGHPVIYFHALSCGTCVSQAMYKELVRHNIKLIMPWRPHFDETSPVRPYKKGPSVFAQDILALMDDLKIETCPFLTNVSGTIWAYVAAAHCGVRVPHITVTAGAVPLSNAQLKKIDYRQRISIQIARHAPKLLPFAMRATVAKIDAGYDQEFMLEHYESSPLDQTFIRSDEMKKIMQASHNRNTKQGYEILVQELYLMARKWDHILHRVTCPVTILQGEQDPSFPPKFVEDAISNRSNFKLKTVPDTAQLLIFQNPKIVFETVKQGMDGLRG